MSGPSYVPKHAVSAVEPARGRTPLLIAPLALLVALAGVAAIVARAGGPAGLRDSADADVALAAEGGDILLCTQASLEERAGLALVIGLPGVTSVDDSLVDRAAAAGVGGVMLRKENIDSEEQAQALVAGLRARLGSHLLVAIDDEGGRVSSMAALGQSPVSARRLGQAGPEAAEEAGRELGEMAASIDVDWVFAPVVDLDAGPAGGVIGDRSFGDDPDEVTAAAGAFARGLRASGLAVTLKHFPGHGGDGDPHLVDTVDQSSEAELLAEDLGPFRALVEDGAEAVMVGHVSYPRVWGDLPASLEPGVYELLRGQGFTGVAITDALGMGAVYNRFGFDVAPAMALAAGADAVLVNQGEQVEVLHDGLVAAVREGRLDEDRLDDAVGRMLALRAQSPDGIVCPG